MTDLKCNECDLKIHDGVLYQLQPILEKQHSIKCLLGFHKYEFLVRLYENHKPLGVAIFRVCERCGHGMDAPIAYKAVYSITKRLNVGGPECKR